MGRIRQWGFEMTKFDELKTTLHHTAKDQGIDLSMAEAEILLEVLLEKMVEVGVEAKEALEEEK